MKISNLSLFLLIPCALLSACDGVTPEQNTAPSPALAESAPQARLRTVPLMIQSDDRPDRTIIAEVAISPEEQQRGMMFRTALGKNEGMVFPMFPPRSASFWMKDTLIPLDIIFINTDGSVALVAANTKPLSRVPISTGTPVAGVLELAGGRAQELGLREGDRVIWGACVAKATAVTSRSDPMNFCPKQ